MGVEVGSWSCWLLQLLTWRDGGRGGVVLCHGGGGVVVAMSWGGGLVHIVDVAWLSASSTWRGGPRCRRGVLVPVVDVAWTSSPSTWRVVVVRVVDVAWSSSSSTWRGRGHGVVLVDDGGGDWGMVVVVVVEKGAAWLTWVNPPDLASPGPRHPN